MTVSKYKYQELTWPEVRAVVAEDRVVVQPVATIEDHGPHLPIDCDVRITAEICSRAATQVPDQVVLMPMVTHGYSPHHGDFPGSINIGWDTFVRYLLDITGSLVGHGFRRLLLVNGHGSNGPLVDMAARLTVVQHPEALCADMFYLQTPTGREAIAAVRESEFPGGMAHACELETSIYLAIEPGLVQMDKAEKDISFPPSEHFWFDWSDGPVSMMEYWSTLSRTGTMGDPTLATAEKGRALLEAAVDELIGVIAEMKQRPVRKRLDHH